MMEFEFELTADDIEQHAQDLIGFHEEFSEFYRTSTRNAAPQALDARETIKIEADPFPFAEQIASMTETRSRLAFDVKLPQLEGDWSPTAIWVSPDTEPEKFQQFQIYFSNGTRLSASRQEKQPRCGKKLPKAL